MEEWLDPGRRHLWICFEVSFRIECRRSFALFEAAGREIMHKRVHARAGDVGVGLQIEARIENAALQHGLKIALRQSHSLESRSPQ